MPLSVFGFWLVFGLYPAVVMPIVFAMWIITASIYALGYIYHKLKRRD